MNVNIVKKKDNKLFNRVEVTAEVVFDGTTPTRQDMRKSISAKLGTDPDLTILREVKTTFGKKLAIVIAHSYQTKDALISTEPEHIRKRHSLVAEVKEANKAQATAKC